MADTKEGSKQLFSRKKVKETSSELGDKEAIRAVKSTQNKGQIKDKYCMKQPKTK